jgi:hypothetical protein
MNVWSFCIDVSRLGPPERRAVQGLWEEGSFWLDFLIRFVSRQNE